MAAGTSPSDCDAEGRLAPVIITYDAAIQWQQALRLLAAMQKADWRQMSSSTMLPTVPVRIAAAAGTWPSGGHAEG